jgi:hypothetical protein
MNNQPELEELEELEEIKNPYVKNPYVDNLQTYEYYINEKPTIYDTIKYYWTALINNQHHKMNYIQLKSRMHRTEMFVDYYTRKGFKIDDVGSSEDVDIKTAYYIIHRIEWLLSDYGYMLWRSRAPYEIFLSKYFFYRNDILSTIPLGKDTNKNGPVEYYKTKTKMAPPKIWSVENYEKIIPRTKSRLVKHSVYLALDLMTMLEFMKNDIDRNDDLLFKVIILTINSLIFIGQFLWERYW